MDVLRGADDLLYATLAGVAWLVARRDHSHRPLAAYLTWMASSELARWGLATLRADAPMPYTGLARFAMHLDQLFVLSWSFLFVALCLHYFLGKKPWAPLAAWAATLAFCIAGYPSLLAGRASYVSLGASIASFFASWGCVLWGILRRRERELEPKLAHLVLILYASTDVSIYLLQLTRDYFKTWPLAQLSNLLLFVACIALHIHALAHRAPFTEAQP